MQKNVPKTITDEELTTLQPKTYASYLLKGEKFSFLKSKLKTSGFMNLYTPSQRMAMIEEDQLDENSGLLVNIRAADADICFDTMLKGIALYLKGNIWLEGSEDELLSRGGRIKLVLNQLLDSNVALTRAEIAMDKSFRGTIGAFCTVGVAIDYNGSDIVFDFTTSVGVYQFKDENLVDMHDGNIENSPRKYNGLSFKTKVISHHRRK